MKPRLKVWVVFGEGVKFGDGRAQLLELIDELGSIKQAVSRFGMSYRSAWGYLQELEKAAGFKLLERRSGGGPGSGTCLTRRGREFLGKYRRFRRGIDGVVARQFARSFRRKI
jgi:molybdate transport system regulatory protein